MKLKFIYGLIHLGDIVKDHIDGIFDSMIEDVKFIKLSTYFKSVIR